MKDKIRVSACTDHTFECGVNVIGRSGEGGTVELEITLTDEMCGCSVYLDFKKPNGEKYRSDQLKVTNNVATYNVPAYLLAESGDLKVQLVLKNENGEIWKSSKKRYTILKSINAVEKIPIIPVGKIEITSIDEIDVKNYAIAQVVDANLKPENIVKDVSILGINGKFKDRIVEVSELPARDIDETVLYKFGDIYYQYADGWQKHVVPKGSLTIQSEGIHDVTKYESVNVIRGYNIAYGDAEPTDTSKLWVKTAEPNKLIVSPLMDFKESLEPNISTLPTTLRNMGVSAVGTKVYVFGGTVENGTHSNKIYKFDTETNTTTTLSATLPIALYNMGASAVGTKIYLFGGIDGNSSLSTKIYEFDTETNTITTLSATFYGYSAGASAVGTKIYLFGGSASSATRAINEFDTETNTITKLSTALPTTLYKMGVSAVGTKIYLFGGYTDNNSNAFTNKIYKFDTETNTITTLSATLPTTLVNLSASAVGTKIYLFGGLVGVSTYSRAIYKFDTETNTITTLPTALPTTLISASASAVGTKIYVLGGSDENGISNAIRLFALSSPLESGVLKIHTSLSNNIFNLIYNIEVGISNAYLGGADGYAEEVEVALYKDGAWKNINQKRRF